MSHFSSGGHYYLWLTIAVERELVEVNEACRQLKSAVTTGSAAAESIVPDIKERSLERFGADVSLLTFFDAAPC